MKLRLTAFERKVMDTIVRTRNDNPRDVTYAVGLNPDSAEDLGRVLQTIARLVVQAKEYLGRKS